MSETKQPLFYPCFLIGLLFAALTGPMLRAGYPVLFNSVIHNIYKSRCSVDVMGSTKDCAFSNVIYEAIY